MISKIDRRSKSKNASFDKSYNKSYLTINDKSFMTINDKSNHKSQDKSNNKSLKTTKKGFQTNQSISLDNSFNRQSPVVSSFLKDDKKIKLRQNLTINTRFSESNILKMQDL